MGEGNIFTLCVSPHLERGGRGVPHLRSGRGGGYPIPGLAGGEGTPSQVWLGGVPHPRSGRGVPWPGLDDWGGGTWTQEGVPPPPDMGWGTPPKHGMGYPPTWDGVPPDLRWGTPLRQISIASTYYTAGGMPLAFTQEDFLVIKIFIHNSVYEQDNPCVAL